jgi:hypothetical protein
LYVLTDGGQTVLRGTDLLVLFMGALILFIAVYEEKKGIWKRESLWLIMFVLVMILHTDFAWAGTYYRYEAYLVATGLFVMSVAGYNLLMANKSSAVSPGLVARNLAICLLLLTCAVPLLRRSFSGTSIVPQASKNIYDQQYQMGRFMNRFYDGKCVAVNDIGAVCYLADVRIVDLMGLADMEVARAKRSMQFDRSVISRLCNANNVSIAAVYGPEFVGVKAYPDDWRKVGEWQWTDNVICGGNKVSFYAVNPEEEIRLADNLKAFASELPAGVIHKP